MIPFLKLIRYKNLLMIALTMFLTKYALYDFRAYFFIPEFGFYALTLTVILIASAGYIINDIYDVEIDQINKSNQSFIPLFFSEQRAWFLYGLFSFLGLFISILYASKLIHYFVLFGTPILLWLYSKYFKAIPFFGNIVVSIIVALPIFLIYSYVDQSLLIQPDLKKLKAIVFTYLSFAFLVNLIREIIKDIEDLNGDYSQGLKTLPILLGIKRTRNITLGFLFVLVILLIWFLKELLVNNFIIGIVFISCTILITFYLILKMWSAKKINQFSHFSKILKIIMLFGILSMLTFKFK